MAMECRERLFYLVLQRHPYAGGTIVDKIIENNRDPDSLKALIENEQELIEIENEIINENKDDPKLRPLLAQEEELHLHAGEGERTIRHTA